MINSACERIKELESQLLEKDISYKTMMEQRDALAARCERLAVAAEYLLGRREVTSNATGFEAMSTAPILLGMLADALDEQPSASLARHDAELLRGLADELKSDTTPSNEWGMGYMQAKSDIRQGLKVRAHELDRDER